MPYACDVMILERECVYINIYICMYVCMYVCMWDLGQYHFLVACGLFNN